MPPGKNSQIKDPQTEKRIHEHLTNQHDLISEEDIRNVKTDISEEDPQPFQDTETGEPAGEQRPVKKTGRTDDPGIETSWNILE